MGFNPTTRAPFKVTVRVKMRWNSEILRIPNHFYICKSLVRFGYCKVLVTDAFQNWRKDCAKTICPRSSRSAQGRTFFPTLRNRKKFTVVGFTVWEIVIILSERVFAKTVGPGLTRCFYTRSKMLAFSEWAFGPLTTL